MSNVMKINTSNMIAFSAKDAYGADFKVSIFDMTTNTKIIDGATMTEGVEPVDEANTTTDGEQPKDALNVAVADASIYSKADRVKIDGAIYRIVDIDTGNNIITINRGLVNTVAAGVAVERVGNLSVFYVELYVTKLGFFLVQAKDSIYGLQYTESVDVKTYLVDDRFDQLMDDVDNVVDDINNTTSFRIVI